MPNEQIKAAIALIAKQAGEEMGERSLSIKIDQVNATAHTYGDLKQHYLNHFLFAFRAKVPPQATAIPTKKVKTPAQKPSFNHKDVVKASLGL